MTEHVYVSIKLYLQNQVIDCVDWKKKAQPKSGEQCFIRRTFLGLRAQEAASQVTLRKLLPGGEGGKPGYIGVLQQRAGSLNVKRLLLIKENRIFQVKEFSTFLCMGRCKSPARAHWNLSFDMHPSYLGPVSCVFTSWVSSSCTLGSGCSLMTGRWQVFFVSFLSSLGAHRHGCLQLLMTVTSCADWYGRQYFISHLYLASEL